MNGNILHYALNEIKSIIWKAALVRTDAPFDKFPQFREGHGS